MPPSPKEEGKATGKKYRYLVSVRKKAGFKGVRDVLRFEENVNAVRLKDKPQDIEKGKDAKEIEYQRLVLDYLFVPESHCLVEIGKKHKHQDEVIPVRSERTEAVDDHEGEERAYRLAYPEKDAQGKKQGYPDEWEKHFLNPKVDNIRWDPKEAAHHEENYQGEAGFPAAPDITDNCVHAALSYWPCRRIQHP
ncbi:MAG: hypothetical protein WC114_05305 [Smithellaceae bacterium]